MLLAKECVNGRYHVVSLRRAGAGWETELSVEAADGTRNIACIWKHRTQANLEYVNRFEGKDLLIALGDGVAGRAKGVRRVMAFETSVGLFGEPWWQEICSAASDVMAAVGKGYLGCLDSEDTNDEQLAHLLEVGASDFDAWNDATQAVVNATAPGWTDALTRKLAARAQSPGKKLSWQTGVVVSRQGETIRKSLLGARDEWHWIVQMLEARLFLPLGILESGEYLDPRENRARALAAAEILVLLRL